jgi:2-methylcitrate dehydratase PrpD
MMILNKLARWAGEITFEDLPSSAVEKAKECLTDMFGVTLAGSRHDASGIVRECMKDLAVPGPCSIFGTPEKIGAPAAALANAFAAHVWDFDDTCYAGVIHPSAVLFPTILALAEEMESSGKDIILSYIVGLEVQGRVGQAVSPNLFMKGWFTTGLLGAIGASVAASKLLRLEPEEIRSAIGLALCQAGGMRQNNGTPAKPYSAGLAAENGVISARMAQKGLWASSDILEGPEGFFHIYCNDQYDDGPFSRLGDPLVIISPGIHFKPYPTCSGTHAAMEAAISLAQEHRLTWRDVQKVHCKTTPTAVRSLVYPRPVSPEQAQFSMPFCIACALKEGALEIAHLAPEFVQDRVIKDLMDKVVMEPVEIFARAGGTADHYPEGAEVTLETADGRVFWKFVGHARGSPAAPFTRDQQRAKFISCSRGVIDPLKMERAMDLIDNCEGLDDIRTLTGVIVS